MKKSNVLFFMAIMFYAAGVLQMAGALDTDSELRFAVGFVLSVIALALFWWCNRVKDNLTLHYRNELEPLYEKRSLLARRDRFYLYAKWRENPATGTVKQDSIKIFKSYGDHLPMTLQRVKGRTIARRMGKRIRFWTKQGILVCTALPRLTSRSGGLVRWEDPNNNVTNLSNLDQDQYRVAQGDDDNQVVVSAARSML